MPLCAGVSSFGFGGTNAHAILEEAPDRLIAASEADAPCLLPISARSEEALISLARAYQTMLGDPATKASVGDLAYTASVRRRHHEFRLAVTGRSRGDWIESLQTVVSGGRRRSRRRTNAKPGVVFVYSGQGPRWLGVGRELFEMRASISRSHRKLRRDIFRNGKLVAARGLHQRAISVAGDRCRAGAAVDIRPTSRPHRAHALVGCVAGCCDRSQRG